VVDADASNVSRTPGRREPFERATGATPCFRTRAGVTGMDEDPTTQELRVQQRRREGAERKRAERAPTEDAAEQHARRAEKNAYLRKRLEERAEAERAAAREAEEGGSHEEP
jgi:hypothetical protein